MAKESLEELQRKAAELQIQYYEQEIHARKTEREEEFASLDKKEKRHAIDEQRHQTLKKVLNK